MHEYSIVQALFREIERATAEAGGTSVHRIELCIGELSGVDPELLQFAFEGFREDTICAAARLEIRRAPATWSCGSCGAPRGAKAPLQCGCGGSMKLSGGDEIMLERLELEVSDVS
jgi:hydrogenase nickel incorporation protein HypA/HybF